MTEPEKPTGGDTFDGTADDVEMSPQVRAEAEARIERAVEKYGAQGRGPGR